METKKCTICKENLFLDSFSLDKVTKDGHRARCKNCESKRRKQLILQKGGKVHVYRRNDPYGFKTCGTCKLLKSHDNFFKSKFTKDKLITNCKLCCSIKSKENYKNSEKRAKMFYHNYKLIDKNKGLSNDLTLDFVHKIITSSCFYCGEKDDNVGCDRIDNSKQHIMNNIVPCCALCNSVKSNKFSKKEMLKIGKVIKEIKQVRKYDK